MIHWITNRWHQRQRALDLQVLWPSCRLAAPNLEDARRAFALHAYNDRAWMVLGRDRIDKIIDELV